MEIWVGQYQFLHKNTRAYRVRNTQALTLTKTSHIKMLQLEAIFTIISIAPKPVEHELQYRVKYPITMSFEFNTDWIHTQWSRMCTVDRELIIYHTKDNRTQMHNQFKTTIFCMQILVETIGMKWDKVQRIKKVRLITLDCSPSQFMKINLR